MENFKEGDLVTRISGGPLETVKKVSIEDIFLAGILYHTVTIIYFTSGGWSRAENYRLSTPLERAMK